MTCSLAAAAQPRLAGPARQPPAADAAAVAVRCRRSTALRQAAQSALSPWTLPPLAAARQLLQPRRRCRVRAAASAPAPQPELRGLYAAPGSPHASGHLRVAGGHSVYWEQHGNPAGLPALFLHGGPGAGCFANHARFFDPAAFCITLVDQRGCGRSTPPGCLADNTTSALVSDLEALRQHLGVRQWLVLGGSWGVALALAYAQAHPASVCGLVLRGVCLMRPSEIAWMYGGGAAALKPLAWQAFVGALPERERPNPLLAYYRRLLSPDASVRNAAAKAWMAWEMAVGFSSTQDLLVWDGHAWAGQQQGGAEQARLPPVPAGDAAAAAAARAASQDLPVLPRGACLPAQVLAGCSSARASVSSSSSSSGNNCAPGPSGRAAIASSTPTSTASATAAVCTTAQQQQQQAGGGGTGQAQPWVWGLPAQGANCSDPEVAALLWQGLSHSGWPGGSGPSQALLETHYSVHGGFLLQAPLLEGLQCIRHIPCIAVQGQLDFVCPPTTAVELAAAWPEMELRLVPGAGHSMYDPRITHELLAATDRFRAAARAPAQARRRAARRPAALAGSG